MCGLHRKCYRITSSTVSINVIGEFYYVPRSKMHFGAQIIVINFIESEAFYASWLSRFVSLSAVWCNDSVWICRMSFRLAVWKFRAWELSYHFQQRQGIDTKSNPAVFPPIIYRSQKTYLCTYVSILLFCLWFYIVLSSLDTDKVDIRGELWHRVS